MSYFPATQACNGPNGTRPLPAAMVARSQRQVAAINAGANRARAAVFGYCTNPASYSSANIQNQIAAAPRASQIIQAAEASGVDPATNSAAPAGSADASVTAGTVAAGVTAGTQTIIGRQRQCWSDQPVQVVPLVNPTPPPASMSLPVVTSSWAAPAPVSSAPCGAPGGASGGVCTASMPANFQMAQYLPTQAQISAAGFGDLPPWGDAYGPAGVDLTGAATSVANWFQNNPAISVAIMLGAVALLLGKKG